MPRILCSLAVVLSLPLTMSAPSQEVNAVPLSSGATANDYARFFTASPLRAGSPLQQLTNLPGTASHFERTRELAGKWENRRLSQIRTWSRTEIQPKISRPSVLKYMFGGPDFVHAATLFPEVPEYILAGLEPLGSLPNFSTMTPNEIESYLSHLHHTLRSISVRSFFVTKEMRADFGTQGVDGVFPVLLYFAALTKHEVLNAKYVKLDDKGEVFSCEAKEAIGVWLQLRPSNPSSKAPQTQSMYYFKTDLSNTAFKAGSSFHQFLVARPGGINYLKAASYLMHQESFSNIRNFLVSDCQYVLQDASGIPADFLALYYDLTYYGNYAGPIDLFSEFDQPGLRRIYQSGNRKPLPFGTGYRMRDEDSVQMFGVRK